MMNQGVGISVVALVSTVAYLGLEARAVEVQCQIAAGLPRFAIVGLPDKAVGESRERVQGVVVVFQRIRRNLRFLEGIPKRAANGH
jgi:hypothetical protein